jgi:hypothetical protein
MTKPTPKPIPVDPMPIDPVDPPFTPPPAAPLPPPDPFDIESLRVGPEYTQQIAVKKLLTRIPMHKPHAQHWVRAHSDPALRFQAFGFKQADTGELFIVSPAAWDALSTFAIPHMLFTAITSTGLFFIWPVPQPLTVSENPAHRTLREAAELAASRWVRVQWSNVLRAYETSVPGGELPEPKWPDIVSGGGSPAMQAIIRIAFKDNLILNLDHPVAKQLLGYI